MQRPPHEFWVSATVLSALFVKGNRFNIEVTEGPDPEAQILNVEFRPDDSLEAGMAGVVVITYDRAVDEPTFHSRDSAFIADE